MKRRIARIIAATMALTTAVTFAGCGSGKDSKASTTSSPGTTAGGYGIDTSKKVELKMVTFSNTPPDLKLVNDEINKILQKDLNCTLNIEPMGMTDFNTKYNLLLTSGQQVDILWTATWQNFQGNAIKGAFVPLDDMLAKAGPNLLKEIPKDSWDMSKIKGKVYSIPYVTDANASWGFMYRDDLRQKYNLPEVKDFATMEAYLEGIKKNEPTILPMIDNPNIGLFQSYPHTSHIYTKFGTPQYSYGMGINMDKIREVVKFTELDSFKEFCVMQKRLVDKGLQRNDVLSSKEDAWTGIRSGKYASIIAASDPGRLNSNVIVPASKEHPDWKFGYLNWSAMAKLSFKTSPVFSGFGIPKSSQNPERALAVLDKLYTDKTVNNLFDMGIEGKHYKIENGYLVSLNDAKNPAYAQGVLGNTFENSKLTAYPKEYDFVKSIYNLNKPYEIKNYWEGFPEDYTSYSAERAAMGQVWTQYGLPLIAGIAPDVDAGIKTLNEKMKAAGRDKIYTEFSKQWNKYLDDLGVK